MCVYVKITLKKLFVFHTEGKRLPVSLVLLMFLIEIFCNNNGKTFYFFLVKKWLVCVYTRIYLSPFLSFFLIFRVEKDVEHYKNLIKKTIVGTSLVVQWLRIHLPMQGTRVRALVWEDPTCRGATKPGRHKYWACALKSPWATTTEARAPRACAPR